MVDGPYAGCSLHLRWFHRLLIRSVGVTMSLSGFLDDGRLLEPLEVREGLARGEESYVYLVIRYGSISKRSSRFHVLIISPHVDRSRCLVSLSRSHIHPSLDASNNSGAYIAGLDGPESLAVITDGTSPIHLSYAYIY